VGKALSQASAWEHSGRALAAVSGTLSRGDPLVARSWNGRAAASSRASIRAWVGALDVQSDTMGRVAQHLRDLVDQALDVAQVVADTAKELIAIVVGGLTCASIPIFGQAELGRRFRDLVRLVWDAKKVLAIFWYFLAVMKDCFVSAADLLTGEPLPDVPNLPAAIA
jgi:hypothetical protein